MAKKQDQSPGLFGPEPPPSPYGPRAARAAAGRRRPAGLSQELKRRLRPVVARLAAEVIAPVLDSIERAHRELAAGRPETARAILGCALESAGRPASGGGTEAA